MPIYKIKIPMVLAGHDFFFSFLRYLTAKYERNKKFYFAKCEKYSKINKLIKWINNYNN